MERNERQKTGEIVPSAAARRGIALEIGVERCGSRQKQLIRIEQLVGLGLTESGVRKRVTARRLHRVHQTVFALHPPPYSWHQRLLAATYACGPGTAVSDTAAAWLLGHRETTPSVPIVANRSGNGRSIEGITVQRRDLKRKDVIDRFGVPCTSPARTVLDCASSLPINELEELLMAADSKKPRLDRSRLDELVIENAGRRGMRNLRLLITDDPKDTDAENERRMLRICRRYGIPEPETQYLIPTPEKTYRVDFAWPELRLAVEADSWRWHGGKLKTEEDTNRDQLLAIAGWIVVHFTRNQIKLMPEIVGPRLVALTSRR